MRGTRPESNLTGGQIQQILDKLLYDSVYLILPFGIFDETLITILSSSVLDKRRKISSAEYGKGVNLLCNLILQNSNDSFDDIRQLKLERTLYLKALTEIVSVVENANYVELYGRWAISKSAILNKKLLKVERKLSVPRDSLYMIYHNVSANLQEFMEFKSSILSQFINLAHKYTSTQIKHKNKNLNYDDLFQNIVAAISKAIDKYDSGKGALTSYVKYWIINAQNQDNSHTDGLAYEISYTQRQKMAKHETNEMNFSSSLADSDYRLSDDVTPEHIVEERDTINRLLRLVKLADINGIFRLVNNIDEFITDDEIAQMHKHMEQEIKRKIASSKSV